MARDECFARRFQDDLRTLRLSRADSALQIVHDCAEVADEAAEAGAPSIASILGSDVRRGSEAGARESARLLQGQILDRLSFALSGTNRHLA